LVEKVNALIRVHENGAECCRQAEISLTVQKHSLPQNHSLLAIRHSPSFNQSLIAIRYSPPFLRLGGSLALSIHSVPRPTPLVPLKVGAQVLRHQLRVKTRSMSCL